MVFEALGGVVEILAVWLSALLVATRHVRGVDEANSADIEDPATTNQSLSSRTS